MCKETKDCLYKPNTVEKALENFWDGESLLYDISYGVGRY